MAPPPRGRQVAAGLFIITVISFVVWSVVSESSKLESVGNHNINTMKSVVDSKSRESSSSSPTTTTIRIGSHKNKLTTTSTFPSPSTFVIAYCAYEQQQRQFDPIGHSEWLARWFGPHVFPKATFKLEPCVAGPQFLTPEQKQLSPEAQLDLLGMGSHVDMRLCRFGSSEIINFIKSNIPQCQIEWLQLSQVIANVNKKFPEQPNFMDGMIPTAGGWTHDSRLHWPTRISQFHCKSGRKLPFFIRHNHEPWFEEVIGVSAQMDGKHESLSGKSLTIYLPLIIDSFGWRWISGRPKGTTNHWSKRLGGMFENLREQGVRPDGFNASLALSQKQYFAASINSHCSGTGAYLKSTILRELFTFTLHEVSQKPIHHVGSCPLSLEDKTTRSGLSETEYKDMINKLHPLSTVEVFALHKFGVVFENGRKQGYVTEKSVNAYAGHAIPIYFGALPDQELSKVLNLDAVIYCDLPYNISNDALKTWSRCLPECWNEFRAKMEIATKPYFIQCANEVIKYDQDDELWKQKVSLNLAPLDPVTKELTGMWDGKMMGGVIRDALRALDYKERR